jgi:hypothetical protein
LEGEVVLAATNHFLPDANDLNLPGAKIVSDEVVVLRVVRITHQQLDVLADAFWSSVAGYVLGTGIEGCDRVVLREGDDSVTDMIDDRAHAPLGLSRFQNPLLQRLLRAIAVGDVHDNTRNLKFGRRQQSTDQVGATVRSFCAFSSTQCQGQTRDGPVWQAALAGTPTKSLDGKFRSSRQEFADFVGNSWRNGKLNSCKNWPR